MHNHREQIVHCDFCRAFVLVYYKENEVCCSCCFGRVSINKRKYIWLYRILLKASKQYTEVIDNFILFPSSTKDTVVVTYEGINYEIPVKYIAVWQENPHKDEILPFIDKYVQIV